MVYEAPSVSCQGIRKSFGYSKVLDDLKLIVPPGRSVAIMGPSGSGKTTLLHILAGLVPSDSGKVSVAGLELVGASQRALTRHRQFNVAMVFQFGELLPELTVAENVGLPLRIRGEKPRRRVVERVLESVGVTQLDARPGQLSGGETQRVALARALVTRPKVLLCDEPTGALDAANSENVITLLLNSTRESTATVVSTHDPSVAARMDETYLLTDGGLTQSRRK